VDLPFVGCWALSTFYFVPGVGVDPMVVVRRSSLVVIVAARESWELRRKFKYVPATSHL
jgi:hypothetical protein